VHPAVQAAWDHLEELEIQEHLVAKDPKDPKDHQDLLEPASNLDQPSSWNALPSKAVQKNVHLLLNRSVDPTQNAVEENSAVSMDATWPAWTPLSAQRRNNGNPRLLLLDQSGHQDFQVMLDPSDPTEMLDH